jgi:hypothetical protein
MCKKCIRGLKKMFTGGKKYDEKLKKIFCRIQGVEKIKITNSEKEFTKFGQMFT